MDYFKKAWKISGMLNKKDYFTVGSICWVCLLAFSLVSTFLNMFTEPMTTGMIVNEVIQLILILIFLIVFCYLNIRLNPFFNDKLKRAFNKNGNSIDDIGNRMRQTYKEELQYAKNKAENDRIQSQYAVQAGQKSSLEDFADNLSSNYDAHAQAIVMEVGDGLFSVIFTYIFEPLIRIFLWPFSCVVSWFLMRSLVKAYDEEVGKNDQTYSDDNLDSIPPVTDNINDSQQSTLANNVQNTVPQPTANTVSSQAPSNNRMTVDDRKANLLNAQNTQSMSTQVTQPVQTQNNSQVTQAFCPNCGSKVDADSKFCTQCGEKLQ